MIENQRSQKYKKGPGFTDYRALTSEVKTGKLGQENGKTPTIELAEPVPSAREPASSNEGNRPSVKACEILDSNLLKRTSSLRLKVKLEPDEWIKDSGCSRHMTGNKDLFSTYEAINGGNVVFGSNTKSKIISKGQICDKKCKVLFSETSSEILKDDIIIRRWIRKNGLYVMKIGNSPKDSLCLASIDDTLTLWHRRLGHANIEQVGLAGDLGSTNNVLIPWLEAEKARWRGQEFNWETATYGKVRYFEYINYFKDFENEFPAFVYKDALTCEPEVSYKPMVVFASHAWRRLFGIRGPLVRELMLEFFSTCRFSDTVLDLDVADTFGFQLRGLRRQMSWREFILALGLHTAKEPLRRMCHRLVTFTIAGRGQAPEKVTTTDLYYLRSMDERTVTESLRGLNVVVHDLTMIDMDELVRLHICERLLDIPTWVAMGPERQHVGASARAAHVDPEVVKEGVQADPAPAEAGQAPQAPLAAAPAPRTIPQRLLRFKEEVNGLRDSIGEQRVMLDGMSRDFARFTTWVVGRLRQLLDASGVTYPRHDTYYHFDVYYDMTDLVFTLKVGLLEVWQSQYGVS
ncbi:integrase, catalytic region, zinc finger, CCHC-type containing protein [Tanacetum coccineum]